MPYILSFWIVSYRNILNLFKLIKFQYIKWKLLLINKNCYYILYCIMQISAYMLILTYLDDLKLIFFFKFDACIYHLLKTF